MYLFLIIYFLMGYPYFLCIIYFIFIFKIKFNYYVIMYYLYPNEYDRYTIYITMYILPGGIESIKHIAFTYFIHIYVCVNIYMCMCICVCVLHIYIYIHIRMCIHTFVKQQSLHRVAYKIYTHTPTCIMNITHLTRGTHICDHVFNVPMLRK